MGEWEGGWPTGNPLHLSCCHVPALRGACNIYLHENMLNSQFALSKRRRNRERRIFVLICIKSIPFWRQFEDWNTNFELSTWDTSSQNGSSDGSGGEEGAAVACLTLSGQRSQSALNWPIGVGGKGGRGSRGKGQQHQ